MAQFLEDPALLTKEKLKSELLANNVPLPSADSKKDVYVQLYLKNLTVLNKKRLSAPAPDTFSSDEELTAPPVSNKSRSGKKATRKTDRGRAEENDVSGLTDEELKVQLLKYGVHSGPIVASTRKLYEKKLQLLLEHPPVETRLPEPETTLPEAVTIKADGNQNGSTHSAEEEQYSDKEGVDPVPEPVPVVTKLVRSRGKTPVTIRTSSRQRAKQQVEETAAVSEESSVDGGDILKEIFPDEPATPTGLTATCRKPIRGAAGRPVKLLNLRSEEPLLQQNTYTVTKSSVADVRSGAPAARPKPRRWFAFWLKLLVFVTLAASLYYAFQSVSADQISACQLYVQDNVITPIVNYISSESPAEGDDGK
ncbi:lamina-associated polypeptide 2, isoforms beta/gamma-like isoform X1 [Cyprinus carpio]|uniref:Lamina-associated polypeptide 2, isoforms beta/gamma-like isoform X1 n=2 Tax=Cyprinus carpio TaxID=7962 RepID=A0A8C1IKY3_CYPCA|nr:lamina-associated polypeptide 2, isoforms beta/gamma-like isoform X1 [Cyprinus carpio]XP_042570945.1 lamina-associated polypeptide 2, isoforms beta/gamma-like isoform X1 [Cyprinus carpio]XP_042570946.1 lamina-associated polypeptide 2, isoforms beta/gamma-like isoform X1 [Cyprinus carpio]